MGRKGVSYYILLHNLLQIVAELITYCYKSYYKLLQNLLQIVAKSNTQNLTRNKFKDIIFCKIIGEEKSV